MSNAKSGLKRYHVTANLLDQSIPLWLEPTFQPGNIVSADRIRRPQGDGYRQLKSSDPKKIGLPISPTASE
jgi:hypothetical protein